MSEKLTVTAEMISTLTQFHDEDEIRTDYSGRGMYGRTCLGYTGEDVIMFAFHLAITLTETARMHEPELFDVEEYLIMMGNPSMDSMGRSTIYYWPNVTLAH